MILEKQKEALILVEGDNIESTKMSLDLESADFLMSMLSKNIYQSPISSTVREYTSNALDSHRKARINDPIIVSLIQNNGNWEFSVQDFGIGLSKEEFINILSKYGKSTKRENSTELGMFGLGAKVGTSYSSSVYFECRKDGIECKFMMYEGEDGNRMDLLYQKETEERNGVKVIIPVNYYDRNDFIKAIKEQLAYFEGVYFNVDGIKNDFKILRNEHFQWSELCGSTELHICLDNVYYPIDWDKLGISRIYLPIGLRFGLSDSIFPTVNREDIRYTQEAKQIILSKITQLSDYFVDKYNESITETDNIHKVFAFFNSSQRNITIIDNKTLDVAELEKYSYNSFKSPILKGINKLDLRRIFVVKDYILNEYNITHQFNRYNFRFTRYRDNSKLSYREVSSDYPIYKYSVEFDRKKQNYLRYELKSSYVYFIQKRRTLKLRPDTPGNSAYNNWFTILQLGNYPKNQWRDLIKEAQYVQSLLMKDFIDLDKVEIPKEWIEAKKLERQQKSGNYTKKVKDKVEGDYTCKRAFNLERYVSGRNCKFEPSKVSLKDSHKNKYLTIFCIDTEENRNIISEWYNVIKSARKVNWLLFSEREYKKIKDIDQHNWITLESFISGNNKLHKRIVTSYLVYLLIEKYSSTFSNRNNLVEICSNFSKEIEELEDYKNKYFDKYRAGNWNLLNSLINENTKYDESIYWLYNKVKKTLEKYEFIEHFLDLSNLYEDKAKKLFIDLCKYNKFKLNLEQYKIKQNEIEPIVVC